MKVSVLGAGAWGTALAVSVCRRHPTMLWARDAAHSARMQRDAVNARYLQDVALPAALRVTAGFDAAVAHARGGLVVVATPMAGLAETLARLRGAEAGIVWLCKGFEPPNGALPHEVAARVCPSARVGVLSGPSFAIEVARGQPTALVAASHDAALREEAVEAFHGESLRVYTSSDPVGVEVGGALKNVLAIASGIADGMPSAMPGELASSSNGVAVGARSAMAVDPAGSSSGTCSGLPSSMPGSAGDSRGGIDSAAPGSAAAGPGAAARGPAPGQNARAALITRGLAEMTRLGVALGARAETFMGLSGLGDLVLTTTGDLSRNRQVGLMLAAGQPLARILAELGHVAEGVATAPMVLRRARAAGVEMPIAEAVAAVIEGRTTPFAALEALMGREARAER